MPKVKIDYSNTIFYKIYCKDTNVTDLYIGHTTNFIQRKHAHKNSCINSKCSSYNCKLYDVIRKHNGWENWKMDIIAFHECDNLFHAKKYEQQYFEEYKATLNSIEPLPKPKPKPKLPVVKETKEKQTFICDTCNVSFGTTKQYEAHNKTKKHKMLLNPDNKIPKKFNCENCDFRCNKQSNWNNHLMTRKHKMEICGNTTEIGNIQKTPLHVCNMCNKEFKTNSGLWKHKKKCTFVQGVDTPNTSNNISTDKELLIKLLLKNPNIIEKLIEII